jgi:hypothetical protein
LRCAKLIEVRLLLVRQRSVEALQRRLHDLDCLYHCIEPLFHFRDTRGRRQRLVGRAICLKKIGRFLGGSTAICWIGQLVRAGACAVQADSLLALLTTFSFDVHQYTALFLPSPA